MIATREVLEPLGFKLRDCGEYWQSTAAFRGGDNPTALQIYKKTGVWIDYAHGNKPLPFSLLMKKMGVSGDFTVVKEVEEEKEARVKVHKLYDQSCLSKLLPHYSFYNGRGINDATLKLYRSGMATGGKMYQRYVFPVFNDSGKICGFSGRDMLNKESRSKWKHLGDKKTWLYPYYMLDENGKPTMNENCVDFSKDCYIIESNGDSLSMTQNGLPNHFVSFGAKLSNVLLAKLISINPKNIILSYNNDSEKKYAGLCGALKAVAALSHHFSKKRLHIVLPDTNDFGDMRKEHYPAFLKKREESKGWETIKQLAKETKDCFDKSKIPEELL